MILLPLIVLTYNTGIYFNTKLSRFRYANCSLKCRTSTRLSYFYTFTRTHTLFTFLTIYILRLNLHGTEYVSARFLLLMHCSRDPIIFLLIIISLRTQIALGILIMRIQSDT